MCACARGWVYGSVCALKASATACRDCVQVYSGVDSPHPTAYETGSPTRPTTRWLPNRLVRNQHTPAARGCSYTTMDTLPLPIVPMQSDAPPSQTLTEPPDARTRRARLHRDGIGANGTFNPPPLTVNPCAQATPPLTVAHGPTVATSPLRRAWLLAAASGLMSFPLASRGV